MDDFGLYIKKPIPVRAKKMDGLFWCETVDGNQAKGGKGDYLCLDAEGYEYPCKGAIFESTYDLYETEPAITHERGLDCCEYIGSFHDYECIKCRVE